MSRSVSYYGIGSNVVGLEVLACRNSTPQVRTEANGNTSTLVRRAVNDVDFRAVPRN